MRIRIEDDDAPTQCRHCGRFVRYVACPMCSDAERAGPCFGPGRCFGAVWLDVDDQPDCKPDLAHEPMPDDADLRLAVLEAFR